MLHNLLPKNAVLRFNVTRQSSLFAIFAVLVKVRFRVFIVVVKEPSFFSRIPESESYKLLNTI